MLKRIGVEDLRIGMYIHAFCGAWLEHPFWRTRFLLTNAQDLQRIHASAVCEVWIDTARGLHAEAEADTVTASVAPVQQAAPKAPPSTPQTIAPRPPVPSVQASVLVPAPAPPPVATSVSMAEEVNRAAAICKASTAAVRSMFQDARMGRTIDTAVAREVVAEIADSVARNGGALISLARLKTVDDYSYMHSVAVCALMVALARQMGLDAAQCRAAGLAGLLHDLGKMDIPVRILNKPSSLTEQEFEVVRKHPRWGHTRLLAAGVTDAATLDVCLHHHEKIDGTGYPDRLAGDAISQLARMGAICDVYDAITSNRSYKQGWNPAESVKRMASWKGHFDTPLLHAFVRSLGIYPIGSLVRLSSGGLAVVVEQSTASLLKPVVKTVPTPPSGPPSVRQTPERIDLSAPGCVLTIAGVEDPLQWQIPDLDEMWSGLQIGR